jgi:hypothetical protein
MDTCCWLLDAGVDPGAIEWFRPRDPWLFNRASTQPLDLVGSYMHLQASWVAAAATVGDGHEFARRLEEDDVLLRIDPQTEPHVFRGATISKGELDALRTIEHVVRCRQVRHIGTGAVVTDQGHVPVDGDRVYVDCTARGLPSPPRRPVFERDRITLQYVTIGFAPWSAATIGAVEARHGDDTERNRLCPPVVFTGDVADFLDLAYSGMTGLVARASDPALGEWTEGSRLNPAKGAAAHLEDPRVPAAFETLIGGIGGALANLARVVGAAS